jgi:hypothetical protein
VAVRVAGGEDHTRSTGNVELVAVGKPRRRVDAFDEEGAHRRHRREGAIEPGMTQHVGQSAALVVVAQWMTNHRQLARVGVYRHRELAAGALGEADVVEVTVCQHDGRDRILLAADCSEQLLQRRPGAGMARVDDGQSVAVLDDVPVRVRVLDAMNSLGDRQVEHHRDLPRCSPGKRNAVPSGAAAATGAQTFWPSGLREPGSTSALTEDEEEDEMKRSMIGAVVASVVLTCTLAVAGSAKTTLDPFDAHWLKATAQGSIYEVSVGKLALERGSGQACTIG